MMATQIPLGAYFFYPHSTASTITYELRRTHPLSSYWRKRRRLRLKAMQLRGDTW